MEHEFYCPFHIWDNPSHWLSYFSATRYSKWANEPFIHGGFLKCGVPLVISHGSPHGKILRPQWVNGSSLLPCCTCATRKEPRKDRRISWKSTWKWGFEENHAKIRIKMEVYIGKSREDLYKWRFRDGNIIYSWGIFQHVWWHRRVWPIYGTQLGDPMGDLFSWDFPMGLYGAMPLCQSWDSGQTLDRPFDFWSLTFPLW